MELSDKLEKKRLKAEAKIRKAAAADDQLTAAPGTGVTLRHTPEGTQLIVSGLSEEQLQRLVPHIQREILIAVTAQHSSIRAALLRFVREGLFQAFIKVLAGLIVGYLLVRLGLS